jgi:hypothetical protein
VRNSKPWPSVSGRNDGAGAATVQVTVDDHGAAGLRRRKDIAHIECMGCSGHETISKLKMDLSTGQQRFFYGSLVSEVL